MTDLETVERRSPFNSLLVEDPPASKYGTRINGQYLFPDPVTGGDRKWTSVTTFVKKIQDEYQLHRWEKQCILKGLTVRPDLFLKACGTDPDDKAALDEIIAEAKTAGGGDVGANKGTALHGWSEQRARGELVRCPTDWIEYLDAHTQALRDAHLVMVPELIERHVIIPSLGLAGRIDGAAISLDHGLTIVDTKTFKQVYSILSTSMQLSSYSRAEYMWDPATLTYVDMPWVSQERGFVIWVPMERKIDERGEPIPARGEIIAVDLEKGWAACQAADVVRQLQNAGKRKNDMHWLYVPDRAATVAAVEAYAARIRDAETVDELSTVWREAFEVGVWGPELQDAGQARQAALLASAAPTNPFL